MADITKSINQFITEEIKLVQDDISSAVSSRKWFLNKIETAIQNRENEPVLYTPKIFNFGSYFKGTKVTNVDEFDVLVVIDSSPGIFKEGETVIGTGVGSANPNPIYNEKYKKSDGSGVSPSKLLNWLKGITEEVVKGFNGQAPERDGQAITATIKSKNLKIDLVPALKFEKDDGTGFYAIPKGDKGNGWIKTQPKDDMDALEDAAKEKDGFRNVIRLLKFIRGEYNFKVSSFAIESAVVNYSETGLWENDLYIDLKGCLGYLAQNFRDGEIKSTVDKSANLISGVESLASYATKIDKIITALGNLESEQDQKVANEEVSKIFKNE
ncbi:hypothetical protein bcere0016_43170 [Bacillus cereus 95/8201]|uniref:hypothetical protein n=1 Tax=Bacillus cereus group TaxID=86661 RepID=UPI0001A09256|nr:MULTISPECIES: hypothetical protein [Bacillus cereus group]AJH62225.1 hypothetical protein BG11_4728 [Bacillus cereus]AJK34360.1 hypothetical protein BF33_5314 [Bacillus cereus]EEL14982.1 hypothetical protein bcere0016_43170 [Bacillus cereus 95/8201]KWU68384.1 hypothetical protein AWW71_29230 [Bacillus cereus]MDA2587730.1 hypothetical protein [Bacillus cereus group sp. Bc062]